MSEKRKVFVSYSRADKDKVLPLVKNLEKNVGTKFWIDLDGIESTAQFLNVIRKAIKECQVVLFMLSNNSINGEWTQREIMFAKECGKRVVPVILDGGGLRDWAELYFVNVNYVDATNKSQLEKLSNEIVDWLGHESVVEPSDSKSNPPKPRTIDVIKRIMSRLAAPLKNILSIIAVLLIILFAIGIYLGYDEEDEEGVPKVVQSEEVELTPYGRINGHDYVELGLSVKWATCNVGASNPEEYGSYFAWGETSTKSEYTEGNSKTYGKSMGDIGGNSSYDAARANWGGTWRLPTKAEFQELLDNCNSEWTTICGVKGRKFTSKINGKSIFLPAAGWRDGSSLSEAGEDGNFWGSTPHESRANIAYDLWFDDSDQVVGWYYHSRGRSVRPVSE